MEVGNYIKDCGDLSNSELEKYVSEKPSCECNACFKCAALTVQRFRKGLYTMKVPPVHTGNWGEQAWISWCMGLEHVNSFNYVREEV